MFYLLHFWCSILRLLKPAQYCLYNSVIKVDILDTCAAMICSYFGIAFMLFFIRIENAVYTSCQNSVLLFINGLTFDIMNTQNNHSLESEWKPMLGPLRPVNDWRFSWLHNVSLKLLQDWLNSVQKRQEKFERDAGQKIFISWGDKHIKFEGLNTSFNSMIETTQFLLWHQVKYVLTESFFQDPLKNWFDRQRSLGLKKDNPSMAEFRYNNAITNQIIQTNR